jgi:hypothetical protein
MWQKFPPQKTFFFPQKLGDFVTEYLILSVFQGPNFAKKIDIFPNKNWQIFFF